MPDNRIVSATEFKKTCLALLTEIEQEGTAITVTRRGHPIAVLGPTTKTPWKDPKGSLAGKIRIVGDIVTSDPDIWDCVSGK